MSPLRRTVELVVVGAGFGIVTGLLLIGIGLTVDALHPANDIATTFRHAFWSIA